MEEKVLKSMIKMLGLAVVPECNLRTPRHVLKKWATAYKAKWVLFVNKRGTLCHAVDRRGRLLVLEAPDYLERVTSDDHGINFFVNNFNDLFGGTKA